MSTEITGAWPALDVVRWAPTKRTLHLLAQMLGKVRLALAPYQPNFFFSALYLTPRGFTTRPIPFGFRMLEISLDVFDARITMVTQDGRRGDVDFAELPSIAAAYEALLAALVALDVDVTISSAPQEIPDHTPLDRDDRPVSWVDGDARAWLTAMCSVLAVFDRWRANFFGRNGLQLWWGAFDLSLMLFTGKHVEPPTNRGYLFKYDLDAEMMSAGLFLGDESSAPFFYAYIYPEPAQCGSVAIAAEDVQWSEKLHEWILPYDSVRRSSDPEKLLREFLDAVYGLCGAAAGWDRSQYTYVPPPLRHGRR